MSAADQSAVIDGAQIGHGRRIVVQCTRRHSVQNRLQRIERRLQGIACIVHGVLERHEIPSVHVACRCGIGALLRRQQIVACAEHAAVRDDVAKRAQERQQLEKRSCIGGQSIATHEEYGCAPGGIEIRIGGLSRGPVDMINAHLELGTVVRCRVPSIAPASSPTRSTRSIGCNSRAVAGIVSATLSRS